MKSLHPCLGLQKCHGLNEPNAIRVPKQVGTGICRSEIHFGMAVQPCEKPSTPSILLLGFIRPLSTLGSIETIGFVSQFLSWQLFGDLSGHSSTILCISDILWATCFGLKIPRTTTNPSRSIASATRRKSSVDHAYSFWSFLAISRYPLDVLMEAKSEQGRLLVAVTEKWGFGSVQLAWVNCVESFVTESPLLASRFAMFYYLKMGKKKRRNAKNFGGGPESGLRATVQEYNKC